MFAKFDGLADASAKFQWERIEGWTFASDLERLDENGATTSGVVNSVILCGKNVTINTCNLPETELRIAYFGDFSFSKEEFNSQALTAVQAVQQFWKESQKAYLITMTSIQTNSQFGGSAFGDAVAMTVPRMIPIEELSQVILHEYFHGWNPNKLYRPLDDKDHKSLFWFQEGFTDYYTRKLALRSGLIDLNKFVRSWNKILYSYAISSARNASNEAVVDGFWSDPDIQQLPYQRGAMFAAYLNCKLHENGIGIDQFMLAFRDDVKAKGDTLTKEGVATIVERLSKVANRFGVDLTSDYECYIKAGETIAILENAFGNCIRVENKMMHAFDIGYNVEKSMASGIFSDVDPDGPAYAAGLRDGMERIERLSGEWGDSSVPVSIRVLDLDGKEQVITYLPQGSQTAMGQQLMITENSASFNDRDT